MKSFLFVFTLLVALLAFYPFLKQSEHSEVLTGLPWQIEIFPDGSTKVFALHLGNNRLSDAVKILGDDVEVAVIADSTEMGRLEMYVRSYRVGLLSGKIILTTNASELDIKDWRHNAMKSDYVATGRAKKYILSEDDLVDAMDEVITGITFIPSVNLDEDVITARFGEPDKRETLDGAIHFLYPKKGLDIVMFEDAKEVLQYVVPEMAR